MEHGKNRQLWATVTLFGSIAALSTGCGKPADGSGLGTRTNLSGVTGYGARCPDGLLATPYAAELELWNCPVPLEKVELTEPLEPLNFTADCSKRTLSIRSFRGTMDSPAWEFNPDGKFNLTLDKPSERLTAHLKTDGAGHDNCSAPVKMALEGQIDCQDRDKAKIQVKVTYFVLPPDAIVTLPGSATHPNAPATAPRTATAGMCTLPASCYFHTDTTVRQCL